jgi:hypothetical protein
MNDDRHWQADLLRVMADAMSLPLTKVQRQGVFDHLARGDRPLDVAGWLGTLVGYNLHRLTGC